ncbi:S-adenosyl-L-methionine-dependent methyltransferase [Pseudoneurospora amorphoporcata]|uniref:S-adenosyl-L-methionine-dependent methyltransferase n=1 Tax=Pseudoneurospora amorphoporcata TaxID=241081 RepID=A0AAN6NY34_9PEZI|nr:S-adenosyl-L-methionine-dependent methyltransferase [Pseudoneurospora amorphoporcata]
MSSTPAKRKAMSPPGSSPPSNSAATDLPSPGPGSPAAAGVSTPSGPNQAGDALTGGHWLQQELPVEREDGDAESAWGSDAESSTASISSSILNYRTLNGRTYHSDSVTDGEYWGPNDKKHLEALEIYHEAIELMLDHKLHMAPIKSNIQRAIDIGTGLGFWAIDFADKYPTCEVTGTDITPVQPDWVPPNVRFEIDDATKEWAYKSDHFDFVHIRFMDGAIENWNALYEQAYRVTKPGGWVEHLDHSPIVTSDDGSVKPGSAMDTYGKVLAEAGKRMGRTITLADEDTMEEGLKAAGFINIQSKKYRMPLSPWSQDERMKEMGLYVLGALHSDVEGVVQYMFGNVMGWTQEEIKAFAVHMRHELKDNSIHGYYHWKYVWGQKPEDAE